MPWLLPNKLLHMLQRMIMTCMLYIVCLLFIRKPFTVTWQVVSNYEASFSVGRLTGIWRTSILNYLYQVMPWPLVKLVLLLALKLHDTLATCVHISWVTVVRFIVSIKSQMACLSEVLTSTSSFVLFFMRQSQQLLSVDSIAGRSVEWDTWSLVVILHCLCFLSFLIYV